MTKYLIVISLVVLMAGPFGLFSLTIDEIKTKVADKEKEIKALEAEADAFRRDIEKTLTQTKTLKRELASIDAAIKQISYNLAITQKKIEATELRIQELNIDITQTTELVLRRHKEITETLRIVAEFDNDTLLAIMLKTDKLSDFFSQMAYLDDLQNGLLKKVQELKIFKANLENDLSASEAAKRELQSLVLSLKNQKKISENKKQERQELLAETKNQEQNFQRLLKDTLKKQEAIQKEIEELESLLRRQIIQANIPPRQPGLMVWPLDNGYVTQEFGEVSRGSFTGDFYSFHNGIDFGAKTGIGTPIKAALDGVVAATGDNGRYAYGKWVVVRHANNLSTLYAHLSLVSVSAGQPVGRNAIIGYMGVTGLATGPHLHFTVYATETFRVENRWFGLLPVGGAVNPRDYL